ncbi:MAG: tetratricopeptide repeat protein, partial [Chloroflexota bacterium]
MTDYPEKYAPTINLAWAYFQNEKPDEAFTILSDAIENADTPDKIQFLVKRSQLYALAFRYDEAIADMDAALAPDSDNPLLYVERGQRILLLYEWDRALADFNHALELDSAYADAYYYRGVLYASVPEGVEARQLALEDFERYLE